MGTFTELLTLVAGNPEQDIATAASGFLGLTGLNPASVLTRSVRSVFPYIVGGVSQGLSANAIQNALSSAGLGVRRSNLLTVVGLLRENFGYPSWLRGTTAQSYAPAEVFRAGWPSQARNYLTTVQIKSRDPLTGEEYTSYASFSSDNLLSNDEIAAQVDALEPLNPSRGEGVEFEGWTYETVRVSLL